MSRALTTYVTTTATMVRGTASAPLEPSSRVASSVEVIGSPSIAVDIAPMPIAIAGTSSRPGRCDAASPPAAPMKMAGKIGAPPEARERQRVGEALAEDEEQQYAHREAGRVPHQRSQLILAREKDVAEALVGGRVKADRQSGDHQSEQGHQDHHARFDERADGEREPLDAGADERSDEPDGDRPAEHRHGRGAEVGQSRDREREVPSPVRSSRPVKISEPMPAASSPGTSTTPSIGPPSPAASSSRNAPSSGDPSSALIAAKLPAADITAAAVGGASRAASRTASTPAAPNAIRGASGPSRHQAQRGQRRQRDPGQVLGRDGAGGLEAIGRRVATGPRQVTDRQRRQQTGDDERGQRPPHRRRGEPEVLGDALEEPLLELLD